MEIERNHINQNLLRTNEMTASNQFLDSLVGQKCVVWLLGGTNQAQWMIQDTPLETASQKLPKTCDCIVKPMTAAPKVFFFLAFGRHKSGPMENLDTPSEPHHQNCLKPIAI